MNPFKSKIVWDYLFLTKIWITIVINQISNFQYIYMTKHETKILLQLQSLSEINRRISLYLLKSP